MAIPAKLARRPGPRLARAVPNILAKAGVAAAAALVAPASPAETSAAARCYTGLAHYGESGALAFTASYRAMGDARPARRWRVVYRKPTGDIIGRKILDFSYHDFVPEFTLRLTGPGDMLGIHRDGAGDWRMVKRQGASGELVTASFEPRGRMAADNGMHPYILAHFDRLMAGKTVPVRVPVPQRQSVVDMNIRRIGDTRIAGKKAVRFRASVDMLLAGWLTDELVFTYDPETRRILAYRGLSVIGERRREPYPVRVRYYRRDVPADAPEVASCEERRVSKSRRTG